MWRDPGAAPLRDARPPVGDERGHAGGQFYTLPRRRPLRSAECVAVLGHVRRIVGGRLLAVWNGSPIHLSKQIKAFLAEGGSQFVEVEKLPAYAPELNSDEGVWQHLKHVELRNLCYRDLDHLSVELSLAVKRLRKRPSLIQSFFAGAELDI